MSPLLPDNNDQTEFLSTQGHVPKSQANSALPLSKAKHGLPWGEAAHERCPRLNDPAVTLPESRKSISPAKHPPKCTVSNTAVKNLLGPYLQALVNE